MNNMIQDAAGNTSSMRVVVLAWVFMLIAGIVYLTILNGAFPEIPTTLASITEGILLNKLVQNHQEKT